VLFIQQPLLNLFMGDGTAFFHRLESSLDLLPDVEFVQVFDNLSSGLFCSGCHQVSIPAAFSLIPSLLQTTGGPFANNLPK